MKGEQGVVPLQPGVMRSDGTLGLKKQFRRIACKMSVLEISGVERGISGEKQILRATLKMPRRQQEVFFRTDASTINASVEPFLPVALIPAMRRNKKIRIDGSISQTLFDGVNEVETVISGWFREFRRVSIEARLDREPHCDPARPSAAFFSGGVDSFFTLKNHASELTHLIFVHGFDIPLDDERRRKRSAENAREVAETMNLTLVEVETNLRDFGNGIVSWLDAYFGAGLAATALLLSPGFSRIYIPSSVARDQLIPMGSHPELDRHWSNGEVEIVHDSVEYSRFEKIRAISEWPPVAEHLRVCYNTVEEGLNCGRCFKCLLTMLVLESLGCLEKISTFPAEIDLDILEASALPTRKHERDRFVSAIRMLDERQANPRLRTTLQSMLERSEKVRPESRFQRTMKRVSRSVRKRITPLTAKR